MIAQDVRFAIRSLRKAPGFVLIATFTLGMGIALTTTTFSLIDAVKHPYVPFYEPERLFRILPWGTGLSGKVGSYEKQRAVLEGTRSFDIAQVVQGTLTLRGGNSEGPTSVAKVTANFFSVVGVAPVAGRTFAAGASGPEEGNAIISYGCGARCSLDVRSKQG